MQALLDVYSNRTENAWRRMSALAARLPENEEVKFIRADLAFLTGSQDLGPALDAMAPGAASNTLMVAETVGLRRAYLAGLRGDPRAAALLIEAGRVAQEKIQRGDRTPALRVELAAAAVLRRDHAGAIEWLGHAYIAGYRDYSLLERDPILVKL